MRTLIVSAVALTLLGSVAPTLAESRPGPTRTILQFHTLYGVDGAFVGAANPIRDVIGDELPWSVRRVFGSLDTRGRLVVVVQGLVFKDDPTVPPELRGKNDETEFRALVSCLVDEGGVVETHNIITHGFQADARGDSVIHERLALPEDCVAPIVMVLAGSEDKWFAMTGAETGN